MQAIKVHFTPKGEAPNPGLTCPHGHQPRNLSGEWLWANQITPNTAKLNNIPLLTEDMGLHDLVEFDEKMEIVKVLERATITRHITFDNSGSEKKVKRRYKNIYNALKEHDIKCEGLIPGLAAIAVPLDMKELQLADIVFGADAILLERESNETERNQDEDDYPE